MYTYIKIFLGILNSMIEMLIENKHPIIIKHEKLKDSFPFP